MTVQELVDWCRARGVPLTAQLEVYNPVVDERARLTAEGAKYNSEGIDMLLVEVEDEGGGR